MPNFGMFPQVQTLLALSTQTTNTTSANLTLPPASAYRFILKVKTVSGTSPTMDVFLATSYDATAGGTATDYVTFLHFAQVTTTGLGRQAAIRPYVGSGDTAQEAQAAFFSSADGATGSTAVVINGPINPTAIKVRTVFGGTTPSFAWELGVITVPQDLSD